MMEMDGLNNVVNDLIGGESAMVGDLRLELENNTLHVIGWSQFYDLSNLSQLIALRELKEIKELFLDMMILSTDLKKFVSTKKIVYNLYYDDNGKASCVICSEREGKVEWYLTLVSE